MTEKIKNGPSGSILKMALVVGIILVLLIPLSLIRGLVRERNSLAYEAKEEVMTSVGGMLFLTAPLVEIPYQILEIREDSQRVLHDSVKIRPDYTDIKIELQSEYRSRGIFQTPVYVALVTVNGVFRMPSELDVSEEAQMDWAEARLLAGISDMQGIRSIEPLRWESSESQFLPRGQHADLGPCIEAPVFLGKPGEELRFQWTMTVSGGSRVSVVPLGREARLNIEGDWPSPSFSGILLPEDREWGEEGFSAQWTIPEVSRPLPSQWTGSLSSQASLDEFALTVNFLDPVDSYAQVTRLVKYGILFLLVPFIVFFLFELLGGSRIHPVQYMLAGAADVVFYLILLALSEHMRFGWSYALAAMAVVILLGTYAQSVHRKPLVALIMPGVMATAYLWLWVTLRSEDYALLIGAGGLFVMVALVMFLTRKVEWYPETASKKVRIKSKQEDGNLPS